MKNKTTLAIAVGLIFLVGGYLFFRSGEKPAGENAPSLAIPAPGAAPAPENATAPGGQVPAKEITVAGTEFSFAPATITVKAGETVRVNFRNDGDAPHNWELGFQGITTRTIGGGQSATVEFTAPPAGTYAFFCSVPSHRERGMEGRLIVQ